MFRHHNARTSMLCIHQTLNIKLFRKSEEEVSFKKQSDVVQVFLEVDTETISKRMNKKFQIERSIEALNLINVCHLE